MPLSTGIGRRIGDRRSALATKVLSLDVTSLEKWVLSSRDRDASEARRARKALAKCLQQAREASAKPLPDRDLLRVKDVLARLTQLDEQVRLETASAVSDTDASYDLDPPKRGIWAFLNPPKASVKPAPPVSPAPQYSEVAAAYSNKLARKRVEEQLPAIQTEGEKGRLGDISPPLVRSPVHGTLSPTTSSGPIPVGVEKMPSGPLVQVCTSPVSKSATPVLEPCCFGSPLSTSQKSAHQKGAQDDTNSTPRGPSPTPAIARAPQLLTVREGDSGEQVLSPKEGSHVGGVVRGVDEAQSEPGGVIATEAPVDSEQDATKPAADKELAEVWSTCPFGGLYARNGEGLPSVREDDDDRQDKQQIIATAPERLRPPAHQRSQSHTPSPNPRINDSAANITELFSKLNQYEGTHTYVPPQPANTARAASPDIAPVRIMQRAASLEPARGEEPVVGSPPVEGGLQLPPAKLQYLRQQEELKQLRAQVQNLRRKVHNPRVYPMPAQRPRDIPSPTPTGMPPHHHPGRPLSPEDSSSWGPGQQAWGTMRPPVRRPDVAYPPQMPHPGPPAYPQMGAYGPAPGHPPCQMPPFGHMMEPPPHMHPPGPAYPHRPAHPATFSMRYPQAMSPELTQRAYPPPAYGYAPRFSGIPQPREERYESREWENARARVRYGPGGFAGSEAAGKPVKQLGHGFEDRDAFSYQGKAMAPRDAGVQQKRDVIMEDIRRHGAFYARPQTAMGMQA